MSQADTQLAVAFEVFDYPEEHIVSPSVLLRSISVKRAGESVPGVREYYFTVTIRLQSC